MTKLETLTGLFLMVPLMQSGLRTSTQSWTITKTLFNQVARNPNNTVFDAKRLIGRKFSDKTVQDDIKL